MNSIAKDDQKEHCVVAKQIELEKSNLAGVSSQIWKNPELMFEEHLAHKILTAKLEEYGFTVSRNHCLPTAFRAEFSGSGGESPVIAILCEYDALPEIGHACGHNLIAESGVATGIAIKAALEANPDISGKVVILGTPAEEGGGGKIDLIDAGSFSDVDICMMVHPAPVNLVFTPFIGILRFKVNFTGKSAHASAYPWEGLNALDAAVMCYNAVSMLRQQIKPTCRIHGIISNGGVMPNIIPSETEMMFYIRAPNTADLLAMKQKLEACINASALATGCSVIIKTDRGYKNLISNGVVGSLFKKHGENLGVQFQDDNPHSVKFVASSDVGDVSHECPTIQPSYYIGTDAPNHSPEFNSASGAELAQPYTLVMAQTMALTALEFMRNPTLVDQAKKEFEKDIKRDLGLAV